MELHAVVHNRPITLLMMKIIKCRNTLENRDVVTVAKHQIRKLECIQKSMIRLTLNHSKIMQNNQASRFKNISIPIQKLQNVILECLTKVIVCQGFFFWQYKNITQCLPLIQKSFCTNKDGCQENILGCYMLHAFKSQPILDVRCLERIFIDFNVNLNTNIALQQSHKQAGRVVVSLVLKHMMNWLGDCRGCLKL